MNSLVIFVQLWFMPKVPKDYRLWTYCFYFQKEENVEIYNCKISKFHAYPWDSSLTDH